jgi:hypothetical protein
MNTTLSGELNKSIRDELFIRNTTSDGAGAPNRSPSELCLSMSNVERRNLRLLEERAPGVRQTTVIPCVGTAPGPCLDSCYTARVLTTQQLPTQAIAAKYRATMLIMSSVKESCSKDIQMYDQYQPHHQRVPVPASLPRLETPRDASESIEIVVFRGFRLPEVTSTPDVVDRPLPFVVRPARIVAATFAFVALTSFWEELASQSTTGSCLKLSRSLTPTSTSGFAVNTGTSSTRRLFRVFAAIWITATFWKISAIAQYRPSFCHCRL